MEGKLRAVRGSALWAVAGVVLVYALLGRMGITCPILFLSGVSCTGCGMTRAWISLLTGDLAAAVSYHPLFWVPPLGVVVWLLKGCLSRQTVMVLIWVGCALFFLVYLLRMANPSDTIVVFHPEDGWIARTLRAVLRLTAGEAA